VPEAAKKIGVTEQTCYRWRKKYGGLRMDQAKRLKDLEKENARLKRLLADAKLDKAILREAAVAQRWLVHPPAADASRSCVELRLRDGPHLRGPFLPDADDRGRVLP
jgi:putative transposase